jgi:hypothetical protein
MLTFALCGKASQAAKVQFISRLGNLCCDFPELASVFVLPASLFFFAVKEVESDSQLRAAASTQLENLKMMMERTRRERLTQFSTN